MPRTANLSKPLADFLRWLADQPKDETPIDELPETFRRPDLVALSESDGLAERVMLTPGGFMPLPRSSTHPVARMILMLSADGPYVRLTADGAALLAEYEMREDDVELDELVKLSQVAPLAALSVRTLQRYVRDGKLPAPDIPGGHGKPNLWYWSKLRPELAKVARRSLPENFPGSRIRPA